MVSDQVKTHGLSKTKFYRHWNSMRNRTLPSYINANAYSHVKISQEWLDFDNFYKDMFESYQKSVEFHGDVNQVTLDRINPLLGYSLENCHWATPKEQSRNKKDTIWVEYKGEKIQLINLTERLNKSYNTVYRRLGRGYTLENALHYEPWQGNRKVCG